MTYTTYLPVILINFLIYIEHCEHNTKKKLSICIAGDLYINPQSSKSNSPVIQN